MPQNLVHQLQAALKAKELFKRDKDYIVQHGEVKIVDEFTGRILEGRRWSEGLHQAVEAKEGVKIKEENQTLATVTLQNYFRMYDKLAGMTGTAADRGRRVRQHLRPPGRADPDATGRWSASTSADLIYKTEDAKFDAVVDDIVERYETGPAGARRHDLGREVREARPRMLEKRGIPHEVLNAKQHAREAEIVAQAGRLARGHRRHQHGRPRRRHPPRRQPRGPGPTATCAPRASTPRPTRARPATHELLAEVRGRDARPRATRSASSAASTCSAPSATRAAASTTSSAAAPAVRAIPGESRFYLSLEDELMRLFATGAMNWVMGKALPDDVPIEAKMVTKAIERAQNTVEQRNAEIRKNVLKYDEVMNEQRKVIYKRRDQILDGADLRDEALEYLADAVDVDDRAPTAWPTSPRSGTSTACSPRSRTFWPTELTVERARASAATTDELYELLMGEATGYYEQREEELGAETHARGRAPGDAADHRPALARAPLRDGLPAGGHQPAGHGPEGPARRVAARGLRDVRRR